MSGRGNTYSAADFWRHVNKSGRCWIWTGPKHSGKAWGYTCFEGVREAAHRIAWRLIRNPHLDESQQIRRTCDTPLCVRPEHHRLISVRRANEPVNQH